MHFHKVNTLLLPLLFIVGLVIISGIDAVENQQQQKGKQDVASNEFDYSEETEPEPTNGDVTPTMASKPYFENKLNVVYYSHEGENITLNCAPKNFNEAVNLIMWYRDELPITNGNTTLVVGMYDVDNKHSLTIYNYTSTKSGNFSCSVMPADVRQYVKIELKAPENITEMNGGASILSGINTIIMMIIMAISIWY
ncbi:uncharacterized protein LOC105261721 [Musca domestica]|uniref:Uncharacterized protein LOC105261721 n=1 Tax=Musca domestica TaxID=7370 RepID=A0ABM3V8T1_MUSDO|nr:uncharacterized protein LOC105261721 [Musca domestica]